MTYLSTIVADGWRCTACGAEIENPRLDSSWRWCGEWQHRCEGVHPQAGHFPTEPVGEQVEHGLWEVDEGATWWVIAADEQDALALTIYYAELAGEEVVELWNEEGWPEPERLTAAQAAERTVYDEMHDTRLTMLVDFQLDPSRRLVACSEY